MKPADFEESEYRGPLYNQLERGNHLVWEPGQVFEKHIGIDRATFVTHPYFWQLHGQSSPLNGVVLLDYEWEFIWRRQYRDKALPDFQLNLFLQAKRSHFGTRPRKDVKNHGITGEYWKFEITPHQQGVLEQVSQNLNGNAIVCYAAPAFHTQAALYQHTREQSIVFNSTFPPVSALTGHGAWYYDKGGGIGVANPDFERIELEPLRSRIERLVGRSEQRRGDPKSSLIDLAAAVVSGATEVSSPTAVDTWFVTQLDRVDSMISEIAGIGEENEQLLEFYRAYAQVRAFCNSYHLSWHVLGNGV